MEVTVSEGGRIPQRRNGVKSKAFWTTERSEMDEPKVRLEGKAKPQSKRSEAPQGYGTGPGPSKSQVRSIMFKKTHLS